MKSLTNSLKIFNLSFRDNLRERASNQNAPLAQALNAVADALDDTLEDTAAMEDMAADMHDARKKPTQ